MTDDSRPDLSADDTELDFSQEEPAPDLAAENAALREQLLRYAAEAPG
jgi:hypothetical protein